MKLKTAIIACSAFILIACSLKKTKPDTSVLPNSQPTPTPVETSLPQSQRPQVIFTPDEKFQNISFIINNLPSDVTPVDYELLYSSEGIERGVSGSYYPDDDPESREPIFLGTSSSGVRKPDTNITDIVMEIEYESQSQGGEVFLRYPLTR